MVLKLLTRVSFLFGLIQNVWTEDEMYRCPDHLSRTTYLKTFKGKCYRFDKTELYWPTARSRCTGEGGDLIQIRDYETQKWVVNTLNELHWGDQDGVWIGAHDRNNEMDWRWVTGERVTWGYWGSGQPNCNFFCVEDCGNLRRDDGGRWHDKPCDSFGFVYSFICQYNMEPPTTTTSTTTTTTTPTTTTTTTTTTPMPTTTTSSTTSTTTTRATTTTTTTSTKAPTTPSPTSTTTTPSTTSATTTAATEDLHVGSSNNTNVAFLTDTNNVGSGKMTGVIVACVLGSVALLLLIGVCFFRSRRKDTKEDSLAMHFDNLTYTVRSMFSGSGMSRQERHLNNQVQTGSQNVYADPNTCCPTSPPADVCTSSKEPSHYSEITEAKVADKLMVYLPKYTNSEYEKCNIAKSKLGFNDKTAYLDACTYSKNVYDTVQENEASSNAMNEQLENAKHQYDECGNVDKIDNSPAGMGDNPSPATGDNSFNHYADLDDVTDSLGSLDSGSLQIDVGPNVYEEFVSVKDQASDLDDVVVNMDTNIDLRKTPAGYNNNLYNSDA